MCVCVLAMMETINTDRGRKLLRKTEDFARETKTFLKKFKNSKMNAAHRKKVKTKKKRDQTVLLGTMRAMAMILKTEN